MLVNYRQEGVDPAAGEPIVWTNVVSKVLVSFLIGSSSAPPGGGGGMAKGLSFSWGERTTEG